MISTREAMSVECAGLHLAVPRFMNSPWRFFFRVSLAVSICAVGSALTLSGDWRFAIVGVFVEGLIFAHMLELVHSCIHGTGFGARRADRVAGVLLGLPMLVSFSDYRSNHLEHHRTLGKSEKNDFFGYEFEGMTTWLSFVRHLLMLGHYQRATKNMVGAITRWNWGRISAAGFDSHIEHLLMVFWVFFLLLTLLLGHAGPFLIFVLPLAVAIPCHVLIELPEHWHCPPVDNPLIHTRSISASWITTWFTNGNNYHLEHHLCPWLPNKDLRDLHLRLRSAAVHYQPSYLHFYLQVFRSLRFTQTVV